MEDKTLLGDLASLFDRHLKLADGDAAVLALWTLHTHALHAADNSPRLHIWSPVFGCGKTTLLDVLHGVVRNPSSGTNPSLPALFRIVEQENSPTLLLDEGDTWLRSETSDKVGVLNAGYGPRSQAYVPRVVQGKVHRFAVWTPVAIATRLKELPGGLVRRSVRIEMHKAPVGWESPRVDNNIVDNLHRRCVAWAESATTRLFGARPTLSPRLIHRDAWRSLFAIADDFKLDAAVLTRWALAKERMLGFEDSVQLALDLRDVFNAIGKPRVHTYRLIDRLRMMEDQDWHDVLAKMERGKGDDAAQSQAKWLGAQLKPFGIKPEEHPWLEDGVRKRGYARASFEGVWAQYLDVEGVDPP